jgi:nucleoside-diphosphate kinase
MSQTTAICQYLGQEYGMDLKDAQGRAHVNQVANDVADIWSEMYKARTGADGGAEFTSSGRLGKWLSHMEGILAASSGTYLFGEQVTYADFCFLNMLRCLEFMFGPAIVGDHSSGSLAPYRAALEARPSMVKFLAAAEPVLYDSCAYKGDAPALEAAEEKAPAASAHAGVPGTRTERTFLAVKPDGVQRGIIGNVITRFENKGFKLVGLKLLTPTAEQAAGHYADLSTKKFFPGLVKFFSSGPIVAMCWEGLGVIKTGRVMLGATNPADSAPGTIRGDYCIDVGRNILHGSDGPESAAHELGFWFEEGELQEYTPANNVWLYE